MEKDEAVASVGYQVSGKGPGYKKLQVWQEADKFAMQIYSITKKFPKNEMYGLTSQLRRAALAVPTNIVEGQALPSKKDFRRFLSIANGSLAEAEYLLSVARELEYIDNKIFIPLSNQQSLTARLLNGLIKSIII